MPNAKELLREQVDRLSEEEARELLGLISKKVSVPSATVKPRLTREVVRERLANRPAFRVPAVEAPCHPRMLPSAGRVLNLPPGSRLVNFEQKERAPGKRAQKESTCETATEVCH